MPPLKPGRLQDFTDSLAEAMEEALSEEWQAWKGVPLPAQGQDERRLLLVAISRGMLRYLKQHQNEILTSITLDTGGGTTPTPTPVTGLDLNTSGT